MKPVEIVKINELIPIHKNGEPATNIEVARIVESGNVSSCQFNIIVGKGLYNIGDVVIYIQPDYCIPNGEIFKEYYEPFGDPKKSKLGKNGRIKAVKFNFSFENETEPIYSNGIILSFESIPFEITDGTDLEKELHVIKYVAEDSFEKGALSGLIKGELPYFLYTTDEDRIELKKDHIDKCFAENEVLSFTIKRDGSSVTIYSKLKDDAYEGGICSRNLEKKIDQMAVSGYIDSDGNQLTKYYDKKTEQKGYFNPFTEKFYNNAEVIENGLEAIMVEVRDAWVDTVKENNHLDKLMNYCKENNLEFALRGELIGQGNKGSGNKLNQDAKLSRRIIWFGVDDLSSGFAHRINYSDVNNNLKSISEKLDLEYTNEIHEGICNYEEIISFCNEVFKKIKEETGQIIEGVVIRSKFSNKLSTKYINPEYDLRSN